MNRQRLIAIVIASIAMMLPAPLAFAQQGSVNSDPTAAQYGQAVQGSGSTTQQGATTATETAASTPGSSAAPSGRAGSLPFTGSDLASMAAIALCLLASGIVFSRLSKPRRG